MEGDTPSHTSPPGRLRRISFDARGPGLQKFLATTAPVYYYVILVGLPVCICKPILTLYYNNIVIINVIY